MSSFPPARRQILPVVQSVKRRESAASAQTHSRTLLELHYITYLSTPLHVELPRFDLGYRCRNEEFFCPVPDKCHRTPSHQHLTLEQDSKTKPHCLCAWIWQPVTDKVKVNLCWRKLTTADNDVGFQQNEHFPSKSVWDGVCRSPSSQHLLLLMLSKLI